jgi:hypothetical protein
MKQVVVNLRLSYEQIYIPARHRLRRREQLSCHGPIAIKTVANEALQVSHRIFDPTGRCEAEVSFFDNRHWWQLTGRDGPMTQDQFISLAGDGSHDILTTLGVRWTHPHQDELEFFAKKPGLLDSTRDEEWQKANRGASKVIFCDSTVLVEAGPPLYYSVPSWTTPTIALVVGPSALDRNDGNRFRTAGLDSARRGLFAARGLAFGPNEFDHAMDKLARRVETPFYQFRIEEVLPQPAPDTGPRTCARALATSIWKRTNDDGGWAARWLRKYVPTLADACDPNADPATLPHRRLLEEFIAVDWPRVSKYHDSEVRDAREIIRRLDALGTTILSDEDEAALEFLGKPARWDRSSARKDLLSGSPSSAGKDGRHDGGFRTRPARL